MIKQTTFVAALASIVALSLACGSDDATAPEPGNTSSSEPGWVWQNPLPHGNDYVAIEALGTERALAVTEFEALETTNGGTTWRRFNGAQAEFRSMNRRGSVITLMSSGHVQVSADNGATWRRRALPQADLQSSAFFDATRGVVVGLLGKVSTTSDGGDTWAPRVGASLQNLYDVAYLDASNIIAVGSGGAVTRSTDGGVSWEALTTGRTERNHAVDITDGTIRVVSDAGYAFTSTDGGDNWSEIILTGFHLYDIDFSDAVTGVIAADDGIAHLTNTGGLAWAENDLDVFQSFNAAAAFDADNLWVCGDDGTIFRTDNGAFGGVQTGHAIDLEDVSFADADVGMAVGPECGVLTTTDGGKTWGRGRIPSPLSLNCQAGDLNAVGMMDSESAAVVGYDGEIWTTSNRGITWTRRDAGITPDFLDVAFVDADNGIIVGEFPGALVTDDGGVTWQFYDINGASTYFAVDYLSAAFVVVSGVDGSVRLSTDGGQNWVEAGDPLPDIGLFDIAVVDENTYVAITSSTSSADVFRTTDGGTTWDSQSLFGRLRAISFDSATHGYIAGDDGDLHVTTDGGSTWERNDAVTGADLEGVFAIGNQTAVVVGDDGVIMRTTTGGK